MGTAVVWDCMPTLAVEICIQQGFQQSFIHNSSAVLGIYLSFSKKNVNIPAIPSPEGPVVPNYWLVNQHVDNFVLCKQSAQLHGQLDRQNSGFRNFYYIQLKQRNNNILQVFRQFYDLFLYTKCRVSCNGSLLVVDFFLDYPISQCKISFSNQPSQLT